MSHVENLLKAIGFKRNEISVYLSIAEKGPLSISELSHHLRVHRPIIYKAMKTLMEKELCSVVPLGGGHKLYRMSDPNNLKRIVNTINIDLEKTLPDLKSQLVKRETVPDIRILRGPAGVAQTFADSIKSSNRGATFYRYTSEKDLDSVNQYLPRGYRRRRDAKKLERLVISNHTSGAKKRPRLERFIKFIPKEFDQFEQNIIQLIYNNKVALIDLNTETCLIIKNKALADFQKVIFKLLYKNL